MAGNRQGEQTRERILDAALAEFVEKGFDGARVEDIAKKAGLTKVMLYYHFNTKENLMAELMARILQDITEKFEENLAEVDFDDPASIGCHLERMLGYLYDRREVMRLIMSESLRGTSGNIGAFTVFGDLFQTISATIRSGNPDQPERHQFLVRLFFFNVLPVVMYSSLADEFDRDFELDPAVSRQIFIDAFTRVLYMNFIIRPGPG